MLCSCLRGEGGVRSHLTKTVTKEEVSNKIYQSERRLFGVKCMRYFLFELETIALGAIIPNIMTLLLMVALVLGTLLDSKFGCLCVDEEE